MNSGQLATISQMRTIKSELPLKPLIYWSQGFLFFLSLLALYRVLSIPSNSQFLPSVRNFILFSIDLSILSSIVRENDVTWFNAAGVDLPLLILEYLQITLHVFVTHYLKCCWNNQHEEAHIDLHKLPLISYARPSHLNPRTAEGMLGYQAEDRMATKHAIHRNRRLRDPGGPRPDPRLLGRLVGGWSWARSEIDPSLSILVCFLTLTQCQLIVSP